MNSVGTVDSLSSHDLLFNDHQRKKKTQLNSSKCSKTIHSEVQPKWKLKTYRESRREKFVFGDMNVNARLKLDPE